MQRLLPSPAKSLVNASSLGFGALQQSAQFAMRWSCRNECFVEQLRFIVMDSKQVVESEESEISETLQSEAAAESLPQIGEADGSLDVMVEGLASVLGPVVRNFDARVEGALKSQSLLTSSIDRLTKELDKLLEDTPIPMVAQHAAKLSGVRKRVASLMSTLRVIQGRIVNMDRMLKAREATTSSPKPRASPSPSLSPPPENSDPQSPSQPSESLVTPFTSSAPENIVQESSEIRDSTS